MSQQSLIRRQAASLALRGARQRPFSCAAARAGDLTAKPAREGQSSRSIHARSIWTTRRNSRYPLTALNTPAVRWFSSDEEGKKNEKKDKKKEAPAAKEEEPKEEEKKAAPAAAAEEDDDCPTWQNPLHHNDPNNEKIMLEDFGPDEEIEYIEAPPLADPNDPDKILASQKLYDLSDEIVGLSMLEMKELVDKIGDHFGFEEPPFTGPGGGGGGGDEDDGGDDAAEAAVEKTAFDLKLVSFDAKSKIKVIKEVRAIAGLGLKESKELVEGAPKVVMKDINKEMAEELKAKLEAVGAEIEVV